MLMNKYGRFMQSHELMPVLGFKPGQHLPKEGFEQKMVNGVWFQCDPATGASSKHRIHYLCDACLEWIPYGRAGQHNKGRDHKQNFADMVEAAGIPVTQRRGS